jgi:DNA-binding MarR family transcriptional regulator
VEVASLTFLLARLGRLNEEFLQDICRAHGTNASEFRVLALLRSDDAEPVSPTAISQWIIQTTGGLTATLGRLEQNGHIERVPDPDDGRGKLVQLTPPGATFADRVLEATISRYAVVFSDVDLDSAGAAVRELLGALERFGGVGATSTWEYEGAIP